MYNKTDEDIYRQFEFNCTGGSIIVNLDGDMNIIGVEVQGINDRSFYRFLEEAKRDGLRINGEIQ